ncbi:MAG: hypothetical protein A2901_00405 [Elusimicrobia bacterium RIFCSPLOWO2_01_FULL_54_10]|nr:MAG: hypothetical protein A2901_00405 [Elusimicrobia bacterium RIFCSPLOWO2_01_FULL_54_10]
MIYTQETIPLNSEFDIQLWLAGQPLTRQGKAVYKISSESGFAIGVSFVDPQKSKDATPSQPAKDFASEAWDWASGLD